MTTPSCAPYHRPRLPRGAFLDHASRGTLIGSVLAFAALGVLAMRAYPGGTCWDRSTRGNDFWQNYLCDLARRVALNGEANDGGAALAQAAMLVLALGLAPLWWIVPRFFPTRPRLGSAVRVFGLAGVLGGVATSLMPAGRFGALHTLAIVAGGAPGLAAACLAVLGLARGEGVARASTLTGAATLAVSMVDFVLYVRQEIVGGPGPVAIAILERLAILLLLAWMCVVAWQAPHVRRTASAAP